MLLLVFKVSVIIRPRVRKIMAYQR